MYVGTKRAYYVETEAADSTVRDKTESLAEETKLVCPSCYILVIFGEVVYS